MIELVDLFDAHLAGIEALAAHRGNNWIPLAERFLRVDRPTMFELVDQAAVHMRGAVSAHEFGAIVKRLFTPRYLSRTGAGVIDASMLLDVVTVWGDGSVAAVEGTMMDTVIDNLLAVTFIRYDGYGGIAHSPVADTCIAHFAGCVPCDVWEAVLLIDSLLTNESSGQPGPVHADAQGRLFPLLGLADMPGIDLLPRIRNNLSRRNRDLPHVQGTRPRRTHHRAPALPLRPRAGACHPGPQGRGLRRLHHRPPPRPPHRLRPGLSLVDGQ